MDLINIDARGPEPIYNIALEGLAEICFDFSGADDQKGANTDAPQFTFPLPLANLNGNILSLLGVAADYDGGVIPYSVTVTIQQGPNSTPMTIDQPPMSGGTATFTGSAKFNVQ